MKAEVFYLDKNCTHCNNPMQALFNNDIEKYDIECVSCLKKHISIDDISSISLYGYKILSANANTLPKQKVKFTHPTQIIEINENKKLSISRTGKFYFIQTIEGNKKTPLRPFCSIDEASEVYPVIKTIKIMI